MTRARVDLVAPPMSGHLHPMLGIGRRLARDVDVRVISTPAAQAEIAAAGLCGCALLAGSDQTISAIVNPPHAVRSNPWRLHAQLKANLVLFERFRAELLDLWRDDAPRLVMADFTVPVAGSAAAERGIPWWTTAPSPCAMETPDGPPAYLGGWKPWPGLAGRVRDAAGRAAVHAFKCGVHRL
ncbi:MAG: glycosyl transferase, partial [Acidobacteria bacterium]|nr:glycosyl transferase [Acidobacteriota bacterium]